MGQKSEDELARHHLGAAIRQLRAERKLSRRELERATGLSYPYLSEIEAGKKSPSTRTLRAIADALGLEAHELLEAAEAGDPESSTAPRRSPFHEAPATYALKASNSPLESSQPQEGLLSPATGGRPPARALLEFGRLQDDVFSQGAAALSQGQPSQDPRMRLAMLVNQLSAEDLELLVRLASRLQESRRSGKHKMPNEQSDPKGRAPR